MSCSFPVKWIITVGIILVTWHYLDEVNNWNLCLKGFYLDERKGSAGRVGREKRDREGGGEKEHIHVCITFMCTCACQTSQCVRLGTPVMLRGSDSPRPDQQALAHCMVWAFLCGKRAQLRGQCHSLCHHPGQRGSSGPAVRYIKKRVGETVWVCAPWLTGIPVAASRCCCLWHCSLLALTPACLVSVYNPLLPPLPPSIHRCHGHYPCQSLAGVSLVFVLSPCSDTLCSPLISSYHSVLIVFKSTQQ